MRRNTFFISTVEPLTVGANATLADQSVAHQVSAVLRLRPGDTIFLADNSGTLFRATLSEVSKKRLVCAVTHSYPGADAVPVDLSLAVSLPKKDKFEWVVQKATELGVSSIVPVVSERSEKKGVNLERANTIAREASEQCGRGKLPRLLDVSTFTEVLTRTGAAAIAFDTSGQPFDARAVRATYRDAPLTVFIGPEGGWGDAELLAFKEKRVSVYSLGSRTLRAETAAIAVASLLLLS